MDPTGFIFFAFFFSVFISVLANGVQVDPNEIYFSQKTVGESFHIPPSQQAFRDALTDCGVELVDNLKTVRLDDVTPALVEDGGGCDTEGKRTTLINEIRMHTALDAIDWGEGVDPRYTTRSNRRLLLARNWQAYLLDYKVTVNPLLPGSNEGLQPDRYEKIICSASTVDTQDDPQEYQCLKYQPTTWGQAVVLRCLTHGLPAHGTSNNPEVSSNVNNLKNHDQLIVHSCKERIGVEDNVVPDENRIGHAAITQVYVPKINDISKAYKVARDVIGNDFVTAAFADGKFRYSCAKENAVFLEKFRRLEQAQLNP